MFCSGCGQALAPGQPVCPQCGRPLAPIAPPVPGFEYQLAGYAGKIRILGYLWIAYAILMFVLGIAGLTFARAFLNGAFGHWSHGPLPPDWVLPMALHFAWLFIVGRAALCFVAGWGLLEHSNWGRVMAIVVAVLNVIHIPFGTALSIATFVILLGWRNNVLYEQL